MNTADDYPETGSRWLHLKTQHLYVVVTVGLLEATLVPHIVYHRDGNRQLGDWIRPLAEFLDGRFERA